jgi:hypothetical protein
MICHIENFLSVSFIINDIFFWLFPNFLLNDLIIYSKLFTNIEIFNILNYG